VVEISGAGFEQKVTTVAFGTTPYPPQVREAVLAISNAATHTAELSQLNFLLGELFADAIVRTAADAGLGLADLELIGSHGQTIYHQAVAGDCHGRSVASTLQIGEAAVIAERTGVPVVADFRTADVAAGGQGAPLVPYVDYLLYRDAERGRISLNIGGIANITAIPAACGPDQVLAFDTGPGNMIIDALTAHVSGGEQKYDGGGRLAASATVNEALLGELMGHPYFAEGPPKSAGREQFGREYVAALLSRGLEGLDLIATATAFTSSSIADAIGRFVAPRMRVDDLIVSGGGLHNPVILRGLAPVYTTAVRRGARSKDRLSLFMSPTRPARVGENEDQPGSRTYGLVRHLHQSRTPARGWSMGCAQSSAPTGWCASRSTGQRR
jgi:anhydro-N-acetylmuramic acid kinase